MTGITEEDNCTNKTSNYYDTNAEDNEKFIKIRKIGYNIRREEYFVISGKNEFRH